MDVIQKWDLEKWNPQDGMEIMALSKNKLWVNLRSEDDVEKILLGGPWFFRCQGLFMKKWMPDFDPLSQNMDLIPIWLRMPGLSILFCMRKFWQELPMILGSWLL